MAYIATQSCVLMTDNATAQAQITGVPESNIMINNAPIYCAPLMGIINGASQGSMIQTAPMPFTIQSKQIIGVKANNKGVIGMGDASEPVMITVTDPSSGATAVIPVTVTVQDAGQNVVDAM